MNKIDLDDFLEFVLNDLESKCLGLFLAIFFTVLILSAILLD